MVWWLWLLAGGVFVALELLGDAAFYLIFLGVAAIGVGVLQFAGADLPIWGQWLLFAGSAIVFMVFFRKKLYDRIRGNLPGFDSRSEGEVVNVSEDVPRGGRTRVELCGTLWTATNIGADVIPAGAQARVVRTRSTQVEIAAIERSTADGG